MNIGDRIKERRKAVGLTQADVASYFGIKAPSVSEWESGKSSPDKDKLVPLARLLKTSVTYLLTGSAGVSSEAISNVEHGPDIRADRTYPEISWVQAGAWTELCDNFQPGNADRWHACHKNLGPCGYVLRVKGQSMTAQIGAPYTFPDGILLYVNPDIEALPEKFVIVRRNSTKEATFKKYTMVDGEPYLEAINPDWPNRYIKLEEGDQFCGVVMHAGFDMP